MSTQSHLKSGMGLPCLQIEISKPLIITKLLYFNQTSEGIDRGSVLTCFAEGRPKLWFNTPAALPYQNLLRIDPCIEPSFQQGESATHTNIHECRNETSGTAPEHSHVTILSFDEDQQFRILKILLNNLATINYISQADAEASSIAFAAETSNFDYQEWVGDRNIR